MAANSLNLAFGVATGVITARLLEADGRGLLAALMFWPNLIAGIGIIGLPTALTYYVAQNTVDERKLVDSALVVALLLSTVVAGVGAVLVSLLFGTGDKDLLWHAIIYTVALIPFNLMALTLTAADQGRQRFGHYNAARLLPQGIYLVGLAGFLAAGEITVVTALWLSWLGTFATAVYKLFAVTQERRLGRPDWYSMKSLLSLGGRFHSANVISLLGQQADRMLVLGLWSNAIAGHYAVAYSLANAPLSVLMMAFNSILYPRLIAADVDRRRQLVRITFLLVSTVVLAGVLGMMAVVPWLLPAMYGHDFEAAVLLCELLLLAYVPGALRVFCINVLAGMGEWKGRVVAEFAALLAFTVAAVPLVVFFDVAGVILALFVSNLVGAFIAGRFLWRQLGLYRRDMVGAAAMDYLR